MPEKCAPVAPAAGSLIDLEPGDFSASWTRSNILILIRLQGLKLYLIIFDNIKVRNDKKWKLVKLEFMSSVQFFKRFNNKDLHSLVNFVYIYVRIFMSFYFFPPLPT